MSKKVSFIIRTKNECRDLEKTCEFIRMQSGDLQKEIIVVDSGSTDGTLAIAKDKADKVIRIAEDNFSWGYALNTGIESSGGEYIFLLSAHCFLKKSDSIENGIKIIEDRGLAALYGRQIGDPEKNIFECAELVMDFPETDYESSMDCKIHGISNACCLLKRTIWESYHFDEQLQSSEDFEWYQRVINCGFSIGYTSRLTLVHGHYFDLRYVYKKDYWREYTGRRCMNYRKKGLRSNPLFIYLYRILHVFPALKKYRIALKAIDIKYSSLNLLKYLFVKDIAVANGRINYFSDKNVALRYENIEIPVLIQKIKMR